MIWTFSPDLIDIVQSYRPVRAALHVDLLRLPHRLAGAVAGGGAPAPHVGRIPFRCHAPLRPDPHPVASAHAAGRHHRRLPPDPPHPRDHRRPDDRHRGELQRGDVQRPCRRSSAWTRPIYVQYGRWLVAVLRGDLGTSWRTGLPVLQMILSRLEVTAELTLLAMLVALAVGVPARHPVGPAREYRRSTTSSGSRASSVCRIPVFWQATMLILAFSLWFNWAPPVDFVSLWVDPLAEPRDHGASEPRARHRGRRRLHADDALIAARGHAEAYIRTARAKGVSEPGVVWVHALQEQPDPADHGRWGPDRATCSAGRSRDGGGVHASRGRAALLWAVFQRDYPLVQGTILFVSALFMLAIWRGPALRVAVDPRIRYG